MFLRELMKTFVAAEAYRKVYKNTSRKAATVAASRCLAKPHVRKRYQQLMERQMKRSDISIDKVLTDYQYALDLAKTQARPAEIVAAAQAQAKLVGLLRERVETGGVGEFPDTQSIEGILETVAREAGAEAAMTLASMFGLKLPESHETQKMKEAALFIADPASDSVN
jgi:Terminase small subunit